MEYIIAINMKLAIVLLTGGMGILSFAAGVYRESKVTRICGLTGFGLFFPLVYFLSKVID